MRDEDLKKLLSKTPFEWREQAKEESKIDRNYLHIQAEEQSQLYFNWASLFGIAKEYRKLKEVELKEVESKWDLKLREDPESYGFPKSPKEAAIKSKVATRREVREKKRDFLESYAYAKALEAAKDSFLIRRSMLKLEGDLWLGEYYDTVTIKEEDEERFVRAMSGRTRGERRKKRKQL